MTKDFLKKGVADYNLNFPIEISRLVMAFLKSSKETSIKISSLLVVTLSKKAVSTMPKKFRDFPFNFKNVLKLKVCKRRSTRMSLPVEIIFYSIVAVQLFLLLGAALGEAQPQTWGIRVKNWLRDWGHRDGK